MPSSLAHRLHRGALALSAVTALLAAGLFFQTPSVSAQTSAAAAASAGQRHIALQGAPNLRDLGGYATADGRHVRWKKIYRSGELSRLTAADYEIMAGLGIAVVCDFRRESERSAAPTKWQGANAPAILNLPGEQGERSAGGGTAANTPPGLSPLLVTSYPTYVTTLASSFRTVLNQLATQNGAVLYHCTAGKDRTGSFSAVLLTMLGVPKDVVMEDYLLSNQYVVSEARLNAAVARGGTRESAMATLGVDRAYLESFFRTIDAAYGSFDEYRRKALGVSDADLTVLKSRLLE
jgi:protein-tyrosine phosphatase